VAYWPWSKRYTIVDEIVQVVQFLSVKLGYTSFLFFRLVHYLLDLVNRYGDKDQRLTIGRSIYGLNFH
jgi:hypothetical protein